MQLEPYHYILQMGTFINWSIPHPLDRIGLCTAISQLQLFLGMLAIFSYLLLLRVILLVMVDVVENMGMGRNVERALGGFYVQPQNLTKLYSSWR